MSVVTKVIKNERKLCESPNKNIAGNHCQLKTHSVKFSLRIGALYIISFSLIIYIGIFNEQFVYSSTISCVCCRCVWNGNISNLEAAGFLLNIYRKFSKISLAIFFKLSFLNYHVFSCTRNRLLLEKENGPFLPWLVIRIFRFHPEYGSIQYFMTIFISITEACGYYNKRNNLHRK